jgi:hypothetical protein
LIGVEKSEGISPIPVARLRTLNQQNGDPEIPVMSWENACGREELVAGVWVNPVVL